MQQQKNVFSLLVIPRSVAVDVLIFGGINSTATTAAADDAANRVVRGIGCV